MKTYVPHTPTKIPDTPNHAVMITRKQIRQAIERGCEPSAQLMRNAGYDIVDGKVVKIRAKAQNKP